MVSPLTATDSPNRSCIVLTEAVSLALWVRIPLQPPAGFTNTYAEPFAIVIGLPGSPTTIVSSLAPTETPKPMPNTRGDAMSLAFSINVPAQPVTGCTNTYAAPWLPVAPTTMVSPHMATDSPNR